MHPNRATLVRYLDGDMDAQSASTLQQHLAHCGDCERTIAALSGPSMLSSPTIQDSKIGRLARSDARTPRPNEPVLDPCVKQVRQTRPGDDHETVVTEASFASEPSQEPFPKRLGEYDLGEPLGSGGMGDVVRGIHRRLHRPVAIKLLRRELSRHPQAAQRFAEEMKAVGQLEHRHIVRAWDAGEADGRCFLAMELVDGKTISDVASAGLLSVADACEIVRQATLGVAAAHRGDFIHRDVKPGNLMLARVKEDDDTGPAERVIVKLMDLGLVRSVKSDSPVTDVLTKQSQVLGTIDYMAPEQASSPHDAGRAADIYSLGATLYRLLTGRTPLNAPQLAGSLQKMMLLAQGNVVPVAMLRPELPKELAALTMAMLARDPEIRPSAIEVLRTLSSHATGADLPALLDHVERRIGDGPTGHSNSPTRSEQVQPDPFVASQPPKKVAPIEDAIPPRRSRRGWLGGILVLSFGAALATLGLFLFQVTTDQGTLIVEIADSTIEAKVVADGLTIVDTKSGDIFTVRPTIRRTGGTSEHAPDGKIEHSIPQPVGTYAVMPPSGTMVRITEGNGHEIDSHEFRLGRGDNVRVRVTASEKSLPVAPPLPVTPDSRVADWVISVGGHGIAWMATGDRVPFDRDTPLSVEPEGFAEIIIPDGDTPVLDQDFENLITASRIDVFDVRSEKLTDAALRSLLAAPVAKTIRSFTFFSPEISEDALRIALTTLRLKVLTFNVLGCGDLTPDLLAVLIAHQTELVELRFNAGAWSSRDLGRLRDLPPSVKKLLLSAVEHLEPLDWENVVASRSWAQLGFDGPAIGKMHISLVVTHDPLIGSILVGDHATDDWIPCVADLPKLTGLIIRGPELTGRNLDTLQRCPLLAWVELADGKISRDDVLRFQGQHPDCVVYVDDLRYDAISNSDP